MPLALGEWNYISTNMTAQPNASLVTGLACLQSVMTAGEAIGSREIARRLGIVHTRCNRLLGTLASIGLVEQDENRKYRIGPALHIMSAHSLHASRLVPAALPELSPWHQEGFTVALGVVWQDQVCFLVHARPGQPLSESIGRHELAPAELSSLGLELISHHATTGSDADGIDHSNLATDEPARAEAIARTRRDGYALRRYANGEISLAVSLGDPPLAAVGISHRHLSEAAIPELASRLAATAGRIVAALPTLPRTR